MTKDNALSARNDVLRPDRRTLMQWTALGLTSGLVVAHSNCTSASPAKAPLSRAFAKLRDQASIEIGIVIFPRMDQIDFTGPFEVLVRMPGARIHVIGTEAAPFRDHKGMILIPEMGLDAMPDVDLLVVPGGPGQEDQMRNNGFLSVLRAHAGAGKPIFSVCTGALLLGAAGLLKGKRATTHWAVLDMLPYFGAVAMADRVVIDGDLVSAAGVTAGIDGAFTVVSMLRGDAAAQTIQLGIQYQPEPLFNAGSPETAPPEILAGLRKTLRPLIDERRETARAIGRELGISEVSGHG